MGVGVGVGDLNEDGVAGGIEYGFMSFATDRDVALVASGLRDRRQNIELMWGWGWRQPRRNPAQQSVQARMTEEETARKRRETEEAEHPHAQEPSSGTIRGLKYLSVAITKSPWSKPRGGTSGLASPQKKARNI